MGLGVFFSIISLILWLHILIFEATKYDARIPSNPFLNNMLIGLDKGNAGFLAALLFAAMMVYLLFCTIKGNFKCGLRIPFLISLHPMKVNETFMNSFLFNVLLLLVCSLSLT